MKRNESILWRRPDIAWAQAHAEHQQMVDKAIERRIEIETDDILRGKGYIEAAVILFEERILGGNPRDSFVGTHERLRIGEGIRSQIPFVPEPDQRTGESHYHIPGYSVVEKVLSDADSHNFECARPKNPGRGSIVELRSMTDDSLAAVLQFTSLPDGKALYFATGYEEPIYSLTVAPPIDVEERKKVGFFIGRSADSLKEMYCNNFELEPGLIDLLAIQSAEGGVSKDQASFDWVVRSYEVFVGDRFHVTNKSPNGTKVRIYYPI